MDFWATWSTCLAENETEQIEFLCDTYGDWSMTTPGYDGTQVGY